MTSTSTPDPGADMHTPDPILRAVESIISTPYGHPRHRGDIEAVDCSTLTARVLEAVHDARLSVPQWQDWQIVDPTRPWSTMDAISERGWGHATARPEPGLWHVVQGWRSLGTSGHQMLIYGHSAHSVSVLEAHPGAGVSWRTAGHEGQVQLTTEALDLSRAPILEVSELKAYYRDGLRWMALHLPQEPPAVAGDRSEAVDRAIRDHERGTHMPRRDHEPTSLHEAAQHLLPVAITGLRLGLPEDAVLREIADALDALVDFRKLIPGPVGAIIEAADRPLLLATARMILRRAAREHVR